MNENEFINNNRNSYCGICERFNKYNAKVKDLEHELQAVCEVMLEVEQENEQLKNAVEFVDKLNKMNERRLIRQAKHLEKIYKLISNKDWNGLTVLYMDTKQDYEEII